MNSTATPTARIARRLPALGLVAAVVATLAGLAYAAPVVAAELAPALVVPTMVAGWLLGFGLVVSLPFGVVVAMAALVSR